MDQIEDESLPTEKPSKIKLQLDKLKNKPHLNKFTIIGLFLILITLPVFVISAKNKTNDSTHAQSKKVLSTESTDANDVIIPAKSLEDDAEGFIAPKDISAANTVKSIDLANDENVLKTVPVVQEASVTKPNIIFILIDDMPYLDDRIFNRLPTIKDMFIDHSVRFTNFYGESPLCCPGRAGYLTGQHTSNHNVKVNDVNLFNPSMTIATQLKKAGYYTFLSGKYFNGYKGVQSTPGWNNFSGYGGGYSNFYLWNNGKRVFYDNEYSTEVIGRKAITYLRRAPAGKPIFAYITPYAVHTDAKLVHQPSVDPKYVNDPRCRNIPNWEPPNYNEKDQSDKPNYVKGSKEVNNLNGWPLVKPCEALLSVDDILKKVKTELKNQGRLSNTIFVFGTDNGMDWGAHGHYGKVWPYTAQVNFFVYWPKELGTSPYTISETLQNIDIAPTFCEIGGCRMGPYPNGQLDPDGKSFLTLLKGKTPSMGRDAVLEAMKGDLADAGMPTYNALYTTPENSNGLWHYIEYGNGEKELYNLLNGPCITWKFGRTGDPCELNNLLASNKVPSDYSLRLASALSKRLKQLKNEKGYNAVPFESPVPTPTPTP